MRRKTIKRLVPPSTPLHDSSDQSLYMFDPTATPTSDGETCYQCTVDEDHILSYDKLSKRSERIQELSDLTRTAKSLVADNKLKEAKEVLEKVVTAKEILLGKEDQSTLSTLFMLAEVLFKLDQFEYCEFLFKRL